jgi:hypothetical protein
MTQLHLVNCVGNVRLFIESIPIPNLESFQYSMAEEGSEEINVVNAAVMYYGGSLVRLHLGCFVSSANIIKIAERCLSLENLTISFTQEGNELSIPAIKAIASLPRLKYLEIGQDCEFLDVDVTALSRCYELKHLSLRYSQLEDLISILRGVGGHLVSLFLRMAEVKAIGVIIESCPNLQYLEVTIVGSDTTMVESIKMTLKSGLKRLAKLKVNGVSARLGTDWEGC